ncbi:hypothetical protein ACWDTG_20895 [Rhodococcus zopfii]|uniref:hypothetical protein n=1 Tax=Rhodococcus zopfii TaxID=43772 RepID=UPI0014869F63|nr:hypothetical protein [Rhodococcus zopfii]
MEHAQHSSAAQECPDCHALAADLEAHKQWHSRVVHDLAVAVEKEVDRRTKTP